MQSKVSFITTAYNAEKYITDTLHSIFNQTYKNIEVIVVNNGSEDSTLQKIKEFENKGIRIIDQENKGPDVARNIGYGLATGEYIKFMDADDLINPECIQKQIEILNGSKEYIAYGEWSRFYYDDPSTAKFIYQSNWRDMSPMDFLTSMEAGPMLNPAIMLLHRNIIDKAGLWSEHLLLYDDTEFFFRQILNSKGIKFSPGAKLYYRSGLTTNLSGKKERAVFDSTYEAVQLMSNQVFKVEQSKRTQLLIANMLQIRVYEMYPLYPDLEKEYLSQIKKLGGSTLKYKSGKIFNMIRTLLGWKIAVRIKTILNKTIYKPKADYFR